MASDITNRVGAPPTHLIVPGGTIPPPRALNVSAPPAPVAKVPKPTDDRVCYVQNCKTGDILNVMPILFQKFQETGQRQVLMVSKDYALLLAGCSYIEPLIWEGDWTDLNGALAQAQERFKNVVSLSTFGKSLSLVRQTPSFALEQWRQAGMLKDYGTGMALWFDERNREREAALVKRHLDQRTGVKVILLADHSYSSPFEQMDDLVQLLRENFGDCQIVRLSEVKAEQVYDLLGLYELAHVLVSIETMHLHLAQATGLPVIALTTDKPELWHGTAWRKQFVLQCRYADYEQRKDEIVKAVRRAVIFYEPPEIEITGTGGYNLTTLEWNGKRVGVYRWHPKPDQWRTELAAWTGERTVKVLPPAGFEQHSMEDGRLFVHNDKLYLSYTVASQRGCVIQYGELDTNGDAWKIARHFQPKWAGNDFLSLQKNWSFWSAGGKLYAAVQRSPEQTVLELDGDKVVNTFTSKSPEWKWGQIRGGTSPIERNGLWLQFFHSSTRNNKTTWGWTYYMGALLMEMTPPFQIVRVSQFPILAGTERYFPVPRWKPRVIFPAGAIKSGEDYVVSMGINDAATGKVTLCNSELEL